MKASALQIPAAWEPVTRASTETRSMVGEAPPIV